MLDAGAEESHALEQAADMRIVDGILGQAQAAGDLGMAFREFASQSAQSFEFSIEVSEQRVGHPSGLLFGNGHGLGDEIDDRVEDDGLGRRLGPEHRVDPQPQGAARPVGRFDE